MTTRRGMVVVVVMMMPRVRVARVPPPRQLGRRQLSAALDPMGASWDEGEEDWEGTDVVVEVRLFAAPTTQRLLARGCMEAWKPSPQTARVTTPPFAPCR